MRQPRMIFPISDDDSDLISPAWVTIGLIALNVMLFVYQISNPAFTTGWSAVPAEITRGIDLNGIVPLGNSLSEGSLVVHTAGPKPIYLTLLSSMFMHGGWMHLGGNMLYLWIFGDNIEHRFGRMRFLLFFLISGVVGSLAHVFLAPHSVIPLVGASGAISGILGAYIVLFPWNKVNAIIFYRLVTIPAILAIGLWAAMQLFLGWGSLAQVGESGGTAYAAHIGGFVTGAVLGLISRLFYRQEPASAFQKFQENSPTQKRLW